MTRQLNRGLASALATALAMAMAMVSVAPARSATASGEVEAERPNLSRGYLCCNLFIAHGHAQDINQRWDEARILRAGTPLQLIRTDTNRMQLAIGNEYLEFVNDYSRDLNMGQLAHRLIVDHDVAARIAGFSPEVREAIAVAKVRVGMTREQVIISLGLPATSLNPRADGPSLRYRANGLGEYWVMFEQDRVVRVETDRATRALVVVGE